MILKYKISAMVLSIFLSITVMGGNSFATDKTDKSKNHSKIQKKLVSVDWLIFSLAKYQKERNLVIKTNERDIKDADSFNRQKVKIYIALKDIDGDNMDEIFAYFSHSAFCGARGNCALNIYKRKQGALVDIGPSIVPDIQIDKSGHQKVLGILKTTSLNHADIIIGDTLYRWTGKRYEDANE